MQFLHHEAIEHLDQGGDHFVCTALAAGVDHQALGLHVDPHIYAAALGECVRQQGVLGLFAQVANLFLAGLAAGGRLDLERAFLGLAFDHSGWNSLALDHQLEQVLPANGFDERAVFLSTWGNPTSRALLRCAAFHEALLFHRFFDLLQGRRPGGAELVHHDVLEH